MLWKRLTFGPILILLVIAGAWLDARLDRMPAPGWLRPFLTPERAPVAEPADPLVAELAAPPATLPPGMVVFPIMLLLSVAGARELARILRSKGIPAETWLTCALAAMGLGVVYFAPRSDDAFFGTTLVSTATALTLVGSMWYYARHKKVEGTIAAGGGALVAFSYLGILAGFIPAIRREHDVWVLVWVLLVTKSSDIGAFFTGKAIGRHKLIFWLSPGKTWEGLVGGLVLAGLVGMATTWPLAWLAPGETPAPLEGLYAGALFALVGTVGDLMASLIKRDAGVKDSGQSLPGFGGVLDVIDSPLLVAPFAFWWLRLFVGGPLDVYP